MKRGIPLFLTFLYLLFSSGIYGQQQLPQDSFNSSRDGNASVQGIVTDGRGKRLRNARVVLQRIGGSGAFKSVKRTTSDGRYHFSGLLSGRYVLSITFPGGSPAVRRFSLRKDYVCGSCLFPVRSDRKYFETSISVGETSPQPNKFSTIEKQILEIKANKNNANFVVVFPPTISTDKTDEVNFSLSLSRSIRDLISNLRKLQPNDDKREGQTRVTPFIKPVLTGDGIEITTVVSDGLPVTTEDVSQWLWNVKATRTGKVKLNFVLTTVIKPSDGKEYEETLDIEEKEYEIAQPLTETAVVKAVAAGYQWLWTTLIVPLGLGAWGLLKRRKAQRRAGFV